MRVFAANSVSEQSGSGYPAPFGAACEQRHTRRLSAQDGLTQFGLNQVRLAPGAWSSQRHWHTDEDEAVYVLAGEAVLVTDEGEHVLRAGDVALFPAGEANAHHLQNRSEADCVFLAVGTRSDADRAYYPDVDLGVRPGRYSSPAIFTNKADDPL